MLPDHEHQPPSPNQPLPDHNSNKGDDGDGDEQNKKKKNIHREIERQRRLEMNVLCASLRSLLPLQFLKGKRAVSDQLNAALDYINWLQKNIKELETKRAKLKRTSNQLTANNDALQDNHPVIGRSSIAVQPYSRGVKVVVHSSHREKSLPLSRAIEVLMHEEMDVVSCTTTRINDATIQTIQSETCDSTILDVSRLQQKFNELLSSPLS